MRINVAPHCLEPGDRRWVEEERWVGAVKREAWQRITDVVWLERVPDHRKSFPNGFNRFSVGREAHSEGRERSLRRCERATIRISMFESTAQVA